MDRRSGAAGLRSILDRLWAMPDDEARSLAIGEGACGISELAVLAATAGREDLAIWCIGMGADPGMEVDAGGRTDLILRATACLGAESLGRLLSAIAEREGTRLLGCIRPEHLSGAGKGKFRLLARHAAADALRLVSGPRQDQAARELSRRERPELRSVAPQAPAARRPARRI